MPKLKNKVTGVVVEVSDETATLLGPEYQPVSEPRQPAKPSRKQAK